MKTATKSTKPAAKALAKALTKAPEAHLAPLALRGPTLEALEALSNALTKVEPRELQDAWVLVKQVESAVEAMEAHLKQVIEGFVLEHGKDVGEKGGKQVVFPTGEMLRLRLHRTGVDSKKLEKLLRARGVDVETCMDARVSYAANTEKIDKAVAKGLLTAEDVASTYYDATWVVQH